MNPNIYGMNNFNQGGGGGEQVSCKEKMKQAWSTVPLFVRFLAVTTTALYLLSWALPLVELFSNLPLKTIFSFQIYRLFTSVFITASIFNVLFAFLSWIPDAIKLETTTGSTRYTINFFINSILIQVLYTLTMFLISLPAGKGALNMPSAGLWPLIMAEITILCQANPDNQVRMFFVPCAFRALYYPWALFAFFTLLNFKLQFDILVGIIYGYLFFFYLRAKIQPSDNFIAKCENSCIMRPFTKFDSFVKLSSVSSQLPGTTFNSTRADNNTSSQQSNFTADPATKNPVSTPFKGKGTVLGKYSKSKS